ncbi:hypothetical protein RISK_002368 [Rhodopirellula islandica]|uniref:Uncharacterized protein n=1 Tax=Rhodopirellula islandica TaxID=595434 RepID=A0A0J1BGU0_RHOIS|nr:hypothetical protein RISK_002368 [Rhodopirellula islandica]
MVSTLGWGQTLASPAVNSAETIRSTSTRALLTKVATGSQRDSFAETQWRRLTTDREITQCAFTAC